MIQGKIHFRTRRSLFSLAALPLLPRLSFADQYPSRPVQLVVPFPAGGVTDGLARLISAELQAILLKPVVVMNKPGAAGIIASEFVKLAPADGYTLMMGHIGTHAVNPSLYKPLSYDPIADFSPIAMLASTPVALFASNKAPGKTWAEILAASRAAPGKLTYASFGPGSSSHLYAELLQNFANVKWTHIPYKGPAPAMQDLLGGQVDFMFDTLASGMPQLQTKRIHAVAVCSAERINLASSVPNFAELGISGMEGGPWFGLFAPKNLPEPIVAKLSNALGVILAKPKIIQQLNDQGIRIDFRSPEKLSAFQVQEINKWSDIIRRLSIKAD